MCENLAKSINEAQTERYNEAIARRDAIICEQEMLRERWRGMGG